MVTPDIDSMAMQLLQAVGLTLPVFLLAIQARDSILERQTEMESDFEKVRTLIERAVWLLVGAGALSVATLIIPKFIVEVGNVSQNVENILFNIGGILLFGAFIEIGRTIDQMFSFE